MEHDLGQGMYREISMKLLEIYDNGKAIPADELIFELMRMEGIPANHPYHHYMMPAALLTLAAIEKGKDRDTLCGWLEEARSRGSKVQGGFCGFLGACGGGVGAGIFTSIYTGATPLKNEEWRLANEATGRALLEISGYPGPRCCKRVNLLGMMAAVRFAEEKLDLHIPMNDEISCTFMDLNNECIGEACPFH